MADDVKGTFWASADSGKPEAGDIRKRKKTLPLVWALQHAAPEDRARLSEIYARIRRTTDGRPAIDGGGLTDEEVGEVLAILERSGARDHAEGEARRYRDLALGERSRACRPPRRKRD